MALLPQAAKRQLAMLTRLLPRRDANDATARHQFGERPAGTGRWVALDYGRRRVVADADFKIALLAQLDADDIRGAVILEVPLPDAPSLVGLG